MLSWGSFIAMSYEVTLQPGLQSAVITVTGADRPGVTAAFFAVLSQHGVQLLDVEQAQFRGYLALAAFAGVNTSMTEALRRDLEAAPELADHSVRIDTEEQYLSPQRKRSTHVLSLIHI